MSTASESTSDHIKIVAAAETQAKTAAPEHAVVAPLVRNYLAGILSVLGGLALWELSSRYLVALRATSI